MQTKKDNIFSISRWGILGTVLIAAVTVFNACTSDPLSPGVEFMPDMYRTPALEHYGSNSFYADSMEARQPVAGTVPRGQMPYQYENSNAGYVLAGEQLKNPIAASEEVMKQGEVLYGKYCLHCHGKEGAGDGLVVTNGGFPPPPSYADGNSGRGGKMSDLTPGKIYHTLMYGLNMMGSHSSQLTIEERWKIVHYVEKLQGKEKKKDDASAEGEAMTEGDAPETGDSEAMEADEAAPESVQ